MLINLRNALMAGKRLPYDAEVEFLESTGTQWIDTGYSFNSATDKVELVFELLTTTPNYKWIFGAYDSSKRFAIGSGDNANRRTLGYNASTSYNSSTYYTDGAHILLADSTGASIDGHKFFGFADFSTTSHIILYSIPIDTPTFCSNARIWSYKHYRNGVLVRDYIPVRKGTVGYLYDRVSGKLFGNAGTGDFVLGPDVVPVEWLQGDGSAYIVLPQSITSSKTTALSIECKYIADVSANNKCVFASYYGSRWYAVGRVQYNAAPVIIARFGNTGQYMRTTDLNGVYTTKIIPSQDKVIENGVEYSATFTAGLNQAVDAIGLFCAYNTNDKSILAVNSSRLYWFNVLSVDGGSIVKNLIPVRVGTGSTWEGAMLDTVNRKIYRNAGTGAFTYGNDLKYPIPAE